MIRKYQKSDLDALMQIWLEGNLDAHDFIDPSYWHDNYELVKKELPNAQLYVDEEEGEIAGFVNYGFKLVKKEINQETSAADCLMEWDA